MAMKDNENRTEREQGGIEYAVKRVSDGAFLWDDDLDGAYQSWEDDEENASWVDTEDEGMRLANLAGLLSGDGLTKGYTITERPWYYEDDLEEE